MNLKSILAATGAALGLGACAEKTPSIETISSCESDSLRGAVLATEYGANVRIDLDDTSQNVRTKGGYLTKNYFREYPTADVEGESKKLGAKVNEFCRTGEFPDNEGVAFEQIAPNKYECRGDSLNIARIEVYGDDVTLHTGNLNLKADKTERTTWEQSQGYTSKKVNVFRYGEAEELARAHCAAPSIEPPKP